MALAWQLDVPGARDVLSQIPAVLDPDDRVAGSMQDQDGALIAGSIPNVEVVHHPQDGQRHPGLAPYRSKRPYQSRNRLSPASSGACSCRIAA